DDDVLVWIGLPQLLDLVLEILERRFARLLIPVRQDVDGKEVDLARQLRVAQPNVPWLGGAARRLDVALDVPDLANELGGADGSVVLIVLLAVPAQDVLIADHHAIDRI